MKKLLFAALALLAPVFAQAATPVRYVQISTNTLTRQSGTAVVQGVDTSTMTVSSFTATNMSVTRSTFTNLTSTNFNTSTGSATNWTATASTATSHTFGTQNGTNQSVVNSTITNLTSSNAVIQSSSFTLLSNGNANNKKFINMSTGSASTDSVAYSQVKVLQVVMSTGSPNTQSISSATFQTVNLSANITPSSASNNILIMVTAPRNSGGVSGTNSQFLGIQRNGSDLGGASGFAQLSAAAGTTWSTSYSYLDSPATTSQITYRATQASSNGSNTVNFGGNSTTPTIILMEVQP